LRAVLNRLRLEDRPDAAQDDGREYAHEHARQYLRAECLVVAQESSDRAPEQAAGQNDRPDHERAA
jgi:hypothetical protein